MTSVAIHLNLLEANVNVTIGTLSKPSLCCSTVKDKVSPISIDVAFWSKHKREVGQRLAKTTSPISNWLLPRITQGLARNYKFLNLLVSCHLSNFQHI